MKIERLCVRTADVGPNAPATTRKMATLAGHVHGTAVKTVGTRNKARVERSKPRTPAFRRPHGVSHIEVAKGMML